ncbi:hypothetical protein IAQ61_008993 [Plenodomus lingam]|uniref:uncharacterized protein n=1 Tax=Leptosphaeria maculans TaxID=5022 RepID=UPI003331B552|nr:hypothetical protein IAQ61_008993 [Plenodomus lingam]
MHQLFTFGTSPATPASAEPGANTQAPTPSLTAQALKIVWTSWCDAVILTQDGSEEWELVYRGSGLTSKQQDHLKQSAHLRRAFNTRDMVVKFFGSAMHDGLRGYVIASSGDGARENCILLFATDVEIEAGEQEVRGYDIGGVNTILDVKMQSGGQVLVGVRERGSCQECVVCLRDVGELRKHLEYDGVELGGRELVSLASAVPVQWEMNATTSTALMPDARVYTYTSDPRYPRCLGRPDDGIHVFESVPFLSETEIVKIASGGYLSATLGSDGELYLWGQVCPGSTGKLAVLEEAACLNQSRSARATGIFVQGDQDELVKCLQVQIDGHEARVYDVAIGHGHIVVAAEAVDLGRSKRKCAVFAAGENSQRQLGPGLPNEFSGEFEEIVGLRDKRVTQLAAAGWSTLMATYGSENST